MPCQTPEWLDRDSGAIEAFLRQIKEHDEDASVKLVCRMGENLSQALTGAADAKSVLNEDGLFEDYCLKNRLFEQFQSTSIEYTDRLCFVNPHSRILEVDSGSGMGMDTISNQMLTKVGSSPGEAPSCSRYDVTNCSTTALEKVKEQLYQWKDLLTFSQCDIMIDPTLQGFQTESYDLILVSSILIVGDEAKRILRNLTKLLRPGGSFIFAARSIFSLTEFLLFGLPHPLQRFQCPRSRMLCETCKGPSIWEK